MFVRETCCQVGHLEKNSISGATWPLLGLKPRMNLKDSKEGDLRRSRAQER